LILVEGTSAVCLHRLEEKKPDLVIRYTSKTVKRIVPVLLVLVLVVTFSSADETSFRGVKVPDSKGRQTKAVLTFSDDHHAVEVQRAKGAAVSIPYAAIDKCSYEYTRKHRISETSIAAAPVGIGAIVMLTKSRSHWLEIDYHQGEILKAFVLHMDKHEYLRILDAVKAHTGKDAEILGNADKR
jgi:hypothetical protein